MTWNLENLFMFQGKYEHDLPGKMRKVEGPNTNQRPKPENEINDIIRIIDEVAPDFVVAQEVESLNALKNAADRSQIKFRTFLIEGNDSRGIDIGFMVKEDLPFYIRHVTYKDEMWLDPVSGKQEKLFSRDLPALEIRIDENQEKPSFVIFGNHAKSKRDRPHDPESRNWRRNQYDRAAELVESYKKKGIPVFFAGDFNIDIGRDHEADKLKEKLSSAFDHAEDSVPVDQRITHTYHPRGGVTHKAQMDDIWISEGLENQIVSAKIYQYKYPDGALMPIPETFQQREKQPSDHRPVIIRVRTKALFRN